MLSRMILNHVAIIDHLVVDFRPGFTVVTGETGAGKSLLLYGIALVAAIRVRYRNSEASGAGSVIARTRARHTRPRARVEAEIDRFIAHPLPLS